MSLIETAMLMIWMRRFLVKGIHLSVVEIRDETFPPLLRKLEKRAVLW